MGGAHGDDRAAALPRALVVVVVACAIATALGAFILRPDGVYPRAQDRARYGQLYDATLVELSREACAPELEGSWCATVLLVGGPDAGEAIDIDVPADDATRTLDPGDRIVVAHYTNPEAVEAQVQYQYVDVNRKPALLLLAALTAAAVIALGRFRGLAALGGLVASAFVLLAFVLPAILEGKPPVPVAVVGASAIAFIALYSAHGFGGKTTVALLATLASLGITAALGGLFDVLAHISGLATEEATILQIEAANIDFSGIALAGLVIGALGALDDVAVTQSSAVWELRAANPEMTAAQLARAGMRIGRDHVASAVNTLVLAYAGASMTLMLLFVLSGRALAQVANGEIVAIELIRMLVGSIGLVACVPIATWLTARVAARAGAAD